MLRRRVVVSSLLLIATLVLGLALFVTDIQQRSLALLSTAATSASCSKPPTPSCPVATVTSISPHGIVQSGIHSKPKGASLLAQGLCTSLVDCDALPPHVLPAEQLVKALAISKNNQYFDGCGGLQHVAWPVEGSNCAEAFVDSSAFITVLLYHADRWKSDDLVLDFGNANPVASQYFQAAAEERIGWTRVQTPSNIQKGDFIFIYYPDHADQVSGHCMMADSSLRASTAPPPKSVASQFGSAFDLDVIDAAPSPHGPTDSRAVSPGKYGANGVGRGTVRLFVKDGRLSGYAWDTTAASPVFSVEKRPIVVARADTSRVE